MSTIDNVTAVFATAAMESFNQNQSVLLFFACIGLLFAMTLGITMTFRVAEMSMFFFISTPIIIIRGLVIKEMREEMITELKEVYHHFKSNKNSRIIVFWWIVSMIFMFIASQIVIYVFNTY